MSSAKFGAQFLIKLEIEGQKGGDNMLPTPANPLLWILMKIIFKR